MKHYILLLLACCLVEVVKAQIPQAPVNLQSPNVAGLGLYGDVPVSLFTGTPSIDIPLYTVEDRSIRIPLSLSYHPAGILPDQHPGWVGLGWTLHAGGAIYRTVNGVPDDYNNPNYSFGDGFYFTHNVLNTSVWNQRDYLRRVAQGVESEKDAAPDEFSFNFLDYNGKFYLDHLGNWQVQSDRPLKVTFNGQFLEVPFDKTRTKARTHGYSPSFSGFTIHAEDGTEYIFGGDTSSIEYSVDFFKQYYNEWVANAWYLTKIITPTGDVAIFTYERGGFTNQMYISVYDNLGAYAKSPGGLFNLNPECDSNGYSSVSHSYEGQLLAPVYLANISTPNIKVTFTRNESVELKYSQDIYFWKHAYWSQSIDGAREDPFLAILNSGELGYPNCLNQLKWYKLSSISISSTLPSTLSRNFRFFYSNTSESRLMLSSVQELFQNAYTFEYNQVELLPGYLANKTDHWGFYNGSYADTFAPDYYALREPNPTVMQYGILNKITYPTGGYTRFVFEPHSYRKQLQKERWKQPIGTLANNKTAGGLRIKKIINSSTGSSQGELVDKEYFYVTDYLANKENSTVSSGILGGQIQYGFSNYIVEAYNDTRTTYRMNIFSSQSVLPACVNSQGSHIGYSEVVEKRSDGPFTRFKFTNFDNGYMDEQPEAIIQEGRTPYEPYTSRACERGKNTLLEEYAADGTKKRAKAFQYEKSSTNFVRCMKAQNKKVCPENSIYYDEGATYKIYTYTYRLKQEMDTVFDISTAPVAVTKGYSYNTHGLIKEVTRTTHNGTKKVAYTYPDNYSWGVYPFMVSAHVLSPVVETAESFSASSGTLYPLRKSRSNYIFTPLSSGRRIYSVASIEDSIAPSQWKKTYECLLFDTTGNPAFVVMDEKSFRYQWGYRGLYPVAVFENAGIPILNEGTQTTDHISLNPTNLPQNVKEHAFYTSKAGEVKIKLNYSPGYSWTVSGALDGMIVSLFDEKIPVMGVLSVVPPLPESSVTEIAMNVPAGWHIFKIHSTEVTRGPNTAIANGGLQVSYWGQGSLIEAKDIFYENFEELDSDNVIAFGYHSHKGYAGAYTVTLPVDPAKNYTIDYQVLRDGKWVYTSRNFTNGSYTVDEGNCLIDDVRVYPKSAAASSFTYLPFVGMRSRTNGRGITESYSYDDLGRLIAIKNNNRETVKVFDYHYKNQNNSPWLELFEYANVELRRKFTKNDCGPMRIPEPVEYVIPAGKYRSEISQEDANIKAYNDLMSNGQQYANENGNCGTWIVY